MKNLLVPAVILCLSAGCATIKPPVIAAADDAPHRCTKSSEKEIVIRIALEDKEFQGKKYCVAKEVERTSKPRACRNKRVWWQVENNCTSAAQQEVMIAFSPFDNNNETKKKVKRFQSPDDYGYIKDTVRPKARGTKSGGPALCDGTTEYEICGAAYKYDVYVAGRLVLDPELEVEY